MHKKWEKVRSQNDTEGELETLFKNSKAFRSKLKELINESLQQEAMLVASVSKYDHVNWESRTADNLGYIRGLTKVLELITD